MGFVAATPYTPDKTLKYPNHSGKRKSEEHVKGETTVLQPAASDIASEADIPVIDPPAPDQRQQSRFYDKLKPTSHVFAPMAILIPIFSSSP